MRPRGHARCGGPGSLRAPYGALRGPCGGESVRPISPYRTMPQRALWAVVWRVAPPCTVAARSHGALRGSPHNDGICHGKSRRTARCGGHTGPKAMGPCPHTCRARLRVVDRHMARCAGKRKGRHHTDAAHCVLGGPRRGDATRRCVRYPGRLSPPLATRRVSAHSLPLARECADYARQSCQAIRPCWTNP